MTSSTEKISDVILIGPVCAGKSTLAPLLAESLQLPCVSLDHLFWEYNRELGYGPEAFEKFRREQKFPAVFQLMQRLCISAVERVFSEYHHSVFDLGAGYTHYEDEHLFQQVRQLLAPYQYIIFILPSPDLDKSVRILKERCLAQRGTDWILDGYDFIEHWVKDHCNHELATLTVYTDGKTPAQTHDEILQYLMTCKKK